MAAATLCLLQWKPLKCDPARYPILLPPPNKFLTRPLRFRRPLDGFPRLSVNCCIPSKNSTLITAKPKRDDPVGVLADKVLGVGALEKPAVAAILLGLLLTCNVSSALAASGSISDKTRSPSSGSSSSRPPSSSRSYRTESSPSSEEESGYSYSTSYCGPSPSGGGGVAVGVYAGPILFLIISMGFAAFVLASGFRSDRSDGEKTSILKLQVGLQGMVRSLQNDLNRIAEVADTSTPSGLSFVLTEATLALLRHPDYCISGYSSVEMKRSMEDVEKRFYQLSIEERGKFDEETLVNANNIRRQSSTTWSSNGISNEYIVITILVAAEGVHKLPAINGSGDLKEALQKLGSIPARKLLVVEVLWTPQSENDTLSERELLKDYPSLRPL